MPTLTRATDVLPDLRASLLLSATMAVTGVAASDAPLPAWQPLRRELVTSSKGTLSVDDVVYGYDQLYEHNQLWAQQRFMGVQCQQDPMDAWVLQEILFDTQPDLLIETGTQNGGGALMYATLMQLYSATARVVTIDTMSVNAQKPLYSIPGFCKRRGCRNATDNPLWSRHVTSLRGLSTAPGVLAKVREAAQGAHRVMVVLDSLHSYENVRRELELYHEFVTRGMYLVVQDTKLDRLRGRRAAKAAAADFMRSRAARKFRVDKSREYLLYSQHSDGFLLRVS